MEESWEDLLCRVYYAGYTDHQHGRYRDAKSAKVVHTAKIRADLLKQRIRELEEVLQEALNANQFNSHGWVHRANQLLENNGDER